MRRLLLRGIPKFGIFFVCRWLIISPLLVSTVIIFPFIWGTLKANPPKASINYMWRSIWRSFFNLLKRWWGLISTIIFRSPALYSKCSFPFPLMTIFSPFATPAGMGTSILSYLDSNFCPLQVLQIFCFSIFLPEPPHA